MADAWRRSRFAIGGGESGEGTVVGKAGSCSLGGIAQTEGVYGKRCRAMMLVIIEVEVERIQIGGRAVTWVARHADLMDVVEQSERRRIVEACHLGCTRDKEVGLEATMLGRLGSSLCGFDKRWRLLGILRRSPINWLPLVTTLRFVLREEKIIKSGESGDRRDVSKQHTSPAFPAAAVKYLAVSPA